jgi:serine/threonine protein kinase
MSQPSWIGHKMGGRYEVEELLGRGGMSTVYRGTDPNLRRTVAIKLIHPHLSYNPEFVRRFEEEAAAVAKLNHPNIIKVFDFDHEDETYYMVLEYVAGESLHDRLKRLNATDRRMPIQQVVEIIAGVCDAVDYAHKRGMIHRDIKPANVMLSVQGPAILMDFGVAKIIGGEQHTATGAVIGTALYMSPEQVRGERPSERSDIYALGVTLFESISGHPPYEADSAMTTMMMHVNDPIPDVSVLNPDTPPSVKAIMNKALAKNPDDRFQSAGAMAAALRAADLSQSAAQASAGAAALGSTLIDQHPETPPIEGTFIDTPPTPSAETTRPGGTFIDTPSASPPAQPRYAEQPPSAATQSPTLTASRAPEATPRKKKKGIPTLALVGGGAVLAILVCLLVGLLAAPQLLGSVLGGAASEPGGGAIVAEEDQPGAAEVADEPTSFPTPTEAPTNTPEPTEEPTPEEPTPLPIPDGPYVRISDITISGYNYVVEYETFGYTPGLPGMHIHFFFDTVSVENAGVPGVGPWYLYGGPNPFQGAATTDRPQEAGQLCALVANPDHSIQPDTGNCAALP